MQLSSTDLLGCHLMGKTYFCERNGLLMKYPEDTCLGALYHQKYLAAKSLCNFQVELAREYMRELRENWYVLYSETPLTIPMMCANKTYSELHLKMGASKFHLKAGCTADLPRHRLLSDWSVLLPQDYVQFDMEWNPSTFLPDIQKYVGPEFHRLSQYGQSRVALEALQTAVASNDKLSPPWFHPLHFTANTVAIITAVIMIILGFVKCCRDNQRLRRERRERRIEDAVRTAINGTPRMLGCQTPANALTGPQYILPLPHITYPPSTVPSHPPREPSESSRPSSVNMSSVSQHMPPTLPSQSVNVPPGSDHRKSAFSPPPNYPSSTEVEMRPMPSASAPLGHPYINPFDGATIPGYRPSM